MDVPRGWYAVAESRELKRNIPLALDCFGEKFVVWRGTNGELAAMADRCPHRGARLSIGRIIDGCAIQCPFHGFEFLQDGSCRLVPETRKPSPNLVVQTLHVRDEHGFLWLWKGDEEPDSQLPWFDSLKSNFWSFSSQRHDWPCHVSRCIENQLDYAHLPFVHRNTIGHDMDVSKEVEFELGDDVIKFFPSGKNKMSGFIEFRFPNVWMLTIVPDRFAQMIAFVPLSENSTRLYLRSYQSFCTLPMLKSILNGIIALQSRYILGQDRQVVLSQTPTVSTSARHEKLFPSDRAISHFRSYWRT